MQKIAFERFGTWFAEAWTEYSSGFNNLLPWGALVFGLLVFQQILSLAVQIVGMASPEIMAIMSVFVALLGIPVQAASQIITCGVGLARWHGREATIEDVKQDLNTYVQGILGLLLVTIFIGVLSLIGTAPGVGLFIAGVLADDVVLVIVGVVLALLLGLPLIILGQALTYFTIPLIVDKRLDFWSAFLQSVDCVRRDILGMSAFSIVYLILYGLISGCTCSIGIIFLAPFFGVLQMRAYRDYFGLAEDTIAPRISAPVSTTPPSQREIPQICPDLYQQSPPGTIPPPPLPGPPTWDEDDPRNYPPPPPPPT